MEQILAPQNPTLPYSFPQKYTARAPCQLLFSPQVPTFSAVVVKLPSKSFQEAAVFMFLSIISHTNTLQNKVDSSTSERLISSCDMFLGFSCTCIYFSIFFYDINSVL